MPFAADPIGIERRLHFAQMRCRECDLLIAQPQADAREIDEYYRSHYYEEHWEDGRAVFEENALDQQCTTLPALDRLWNGWTPALSSSIVEVGCGYGAMLVALGDRGYRMTGVELSERAARFCRSNGFNVIVGRAPDLPLMPASYDVVLSRHVIEHVAEPIAFVQSLTRALRPAGLIVIETENARISQYAWDRFRARVRGQIPAFRSSTDHTHVFQARHLETLLVQAGCAEVRTGFYPAAPAIESFHWRLYKGLFRSIDRLRREGEYLLAVGRKAA